MTLLLAALACLVAPTPAQRAAPTKLEQDQVVAAIHDNFGASVEPVIDISPFFLRGDFDGDGLDDLAAVVNVEKSRADLRAHGVRYVDVDAYSAKNGAQGDPAAIEPRNCLGIAVTHGAPGGAGTSARKYVFYECFSSVELVGKGRRVGRRGGSRGRAPVPKGDSMLLELENGGATLIYWDGRTYRGFGVRGGD